MADTNILKKLIDGELPTVNVEIALSKDTIIDMAAAALCVAIVVALLSKYILQKL